MMNISPIVNSFKCTVFAQEIVNVNNLSRSIRNNIDTALNYNIIAIDIFVLSRIYMSHRNRSYKF